ncbi:MAG TPA: PLP-dependent aminotransferase family protein [Thermoanaerobaculaceae bacterium]|nr:PLP-dependent aminotransferase family protein [Thermoanaerobaculaceae bacterium]HPS77602.1 PLP-dependent aminotransferase family protein [Thermoanaerobaculaceae bacterium]
MLDALHAAARSALSGDPVRPLYLRLAQALSPHVSQAGGELPSARCLAGELGLNRATVTAAYRELSRQGLLVLRPGRPRRGGYGQPTPVSDPGRSGPIDLARYAPDRELLPSGRTFEWLGVGAAEGDAVAQYGDTLGFRPLRDWVAQRLAGYGIVTAPEQVILTGGVQNALDLLCRTLLQPGDEVLVEDPSYPGLPPLLALHGARAVGVPVGVEGLDLHALCEGARRHRPRLAILTPTLQNPSGQVMDARSRVASLDALRAAGCVVVEEFFDPALVCDGPAPAPLAALDDRVVVVGSFSKALFPGLRVGWITGPADLLAAVARIKQGADLAGSAFLEAAAWTLCARGIFASQCQRLQALASQRRQRVVEALRRVKGELRWSWPRGGFSLLVELHPGQSSREVAQRAATLGAWVLPGPTMSVSGRDDVLRVAFAAVGGEALERGLGLLEQALAPHDMAQALV